MKRLAAAFLVLFAASIAARAQSVRIQFPQGRTTAMLEGKVDEATLGKVDYVLRARGGQQMNVHITSPKGNAHFRIYRANYDDVLAGADDASEWSGTLPATGDYHIYVFPTTTGTVAFTLEVTIPPARAPRTDYTGYYFVLSHGENDVHKGFEEFEGFELVMMSYRTDGTSVPVRPRGTVHAGKAFNLSHVQIEGDHISFDTSTVRGVSYSFEGAFLNTDDPDAPVLRGRVVKFVNGAKAAEAQLEFIMEEGD